MKALPSIAFGEFTGSAGDVTARSIGGRTLLNHKAYQSKVKTPSQAVSRNTLSKVSRAYKQLTDSQMKAWGAKFVVPNLNLKNNYASIRT